MHDKSRPLRRWNCHSIDPRGAGVQIGQQAEFKTKPATIGVLFDVGPVCRGSATVGCVLGRVR
jgi:hypothetical protein